jgi:cytochrome c biogenesis protein CcmG, thiol:disulfide interchange protein DsbE
MPEQMPTPSEPSIRAAEAAPARSRLALLPVVLFGAVSLMFFFALRTSDPQKLPSTLIGKPAPKLELPALEGLNDNGKGVPGIGPSDLIRGTPVIVNFWASWCAPCVAEHPLLIILKEKSGVPLIGVNYKDQAPGARRFLGRYGNPFNAVGVDPNGRAAIEWGVYGMPETFILDAHGRIAHKHIGALTEEAVDRVLLPAIKKARGGS